MLGPPVESSGAPQPLQSLWRPRHKAFPGLRGLGKAALEPSLRLQRQAIKLGASRDPIGDLAAWLDALYERCRQEQLIDVAIDQAIVAIDDLLFLRQPERCDEMLKAVDVFRVDVSVALALLMETLRAKHVLPSREGFYHQLEQRLHAEQFADAEAEALLANLR